MGIEQKYEGGNNIPMTDEQLKREHLDKSAITMTAEMEEALQKELDGIDMKIISASSEEEKKDLIARQLELEVLLGIHGVDTNERTELV